MLTEVLVKQRQEIYAYDNLERVINVVLRLYVGNTAIFSFDEAENRPHAYKTNPDVITSLKLTKEINTLSTLSFTTLITNEVFNRYGGITVKKSVIILADDNLCLFIGKVSSVSKNAITGEVEVEAEELLGCMRDIIAVDDAYTTIVENGENRKVHLYTYRQLLNKAISSGLPSGYGGAYTSIPSYTLSIDSSAANKLANEIIQDITGTDCLSLVYDTINPWVHGVLSGKATGYYTIKHNRGDYVEYTVSSYRVSYSTELVDANVSRDSNGYLYYGSDDLVNMQQEIKFQYGYNILNVSFEDSNKDPFTAALAYGTYTLSGSSEEQFTTYRYQNYDSGNPTSKYGTIEKALNVGKIGSDYASTSAAIDEFRSKVAGFLEDKCRLFCDNCIINGIDPYYIKTTNRGTPIDVGDLVRISIDNTTYNSIDYSDYCLSLEVDFFNHENDRYIIGPYIPDNLLEYTVANSYERAKK